MASRMDKQPEDNEIAEAIRSQLGGTTDVDQVVVKGDLLQIHVTEPFYNRLAMDRERGRKIVLTLMESMRKLSGLSDVTVRVYCNKEKVIEGKAKPFGGDNVIYAYDL